MRRLSILIVIVTALVMGILSGTPEAAAERGAVSRVRIIHAASGPPYLDPRLRDVAGELQSVFRYTSYRLLNEQTLSLAFNTTGTVPIPGGRLLELTPVGGRQGRIEFRIAILKNTVRVFATDFRLRDGSSITIGGPGFEKGFLLFNIEGRSR